MKYKIKNHIIDAKSPVEALKIHKLLDSKCKDAYLIQLKEDKEVYWQEDDHFGRSKKYAKRFNTYEEAKTKANAVVSGWPYVVDIIKDSLKDSEEEDIDYLTEEEYQAVEDYRKAIANTTDPKLLRVFAHILKEETEHIEELESENVEDSCKTKDYQPPYVIWVKEAGKWKVWGGTHSKDVDKNAFKAKGYEDVVVVKNGEEPR